METYIVRVNGEEFEVEIEKTGGSADHLAEAAEAAHAGVSKIAAAAREKKAARRAAGRADGEPVVCGTAGKVFKVVAHEGEAVKSGDTVVVLEAMKMEIPVVAPKDGTISRILVSEGESTASGQTVAYVE